MEGSDSEPDTDSEPEAGSLEKGDAAMEWIISPTSLQARQEDMITKKLLDLSKFWREKLFAGYYD